MRQRIKKMKHLLLYSVVSCLLFLADAACAQVSKDMKVSKDPAQEAFMNIGFTQKLDDQVPLELTFRDEEGVERQLKDFVNKKPVVLALVYYECPSLCNLLLNGMLESLKEMKFEVGEEFDVLTVSFDHEETHVLAKAKKEAYAKAYERTGANTGWHFLVGKKDAVETLTAATGFSYKYNEETDEFAHRAGLIVLTPEGKISRYFPGVSFTARDLEFGLIDASKGKIGNLADKLFMLCYHYDPETGKYGVAIGRTLTGACLATVGLVSLLIFILIRQERRS